MLHFTTMALQVGGRMALRPTGVNCDGDVYGISCASEEYGADIIEDALEGGLQYDSEGNLITPAYLPADDWCPNCGHSLWMCSGH
jgi:hypothetical protein